MRCSYLLVLPNKCSLRSSRGSVSGVLRFEELSPLHLQILAGGPRPKNARSRFGGESGRSSSEGSKGGSCEGGSSNSCGFLVQFNCKRSGYVLDLPICIAMEKRPISPSGYVLDLPMCIAMDKCPNGKPTPSTRPPLYSLPSSGGFPRGSEAFLGGSSCVGASNCMDRGGDDTI